jgi:hypothetical protein
MFRFTVLDSVGLALGAANLPLPTDGSACSDSFTAKPGSGYVDFTGACIAVTAGQSYSFRIELVGYPAPVCDPTHLVCSSGPNGAGGSCMTDSECDVEPGVAIVTGNPYAGGVQTYNDAAPETDIDLAFRTWVAPAP